MFVYGKLESKDIALANQLNALGVEEWRKEFFSSEKPNSFVCYCKDQEKIVGTEGYIDYLLFYRGKLQQTHRSERTLLNPTHRGKGIFEALVIECDHIANAQESHMIWGATAALKPFVRAGFESFIGFRNYVFYPAQHSWKKRLNNFFQSIHILSPIRLYRVWKYRNLEEIKKTIAFLCLFKPGAKSEQKIHIAEFDETVAKALLQSFSSENEIYVLYPEEKLFSWLEKKNLCYFRHLLLNEENKPIGHAICKLDQKTKILSVVDLFFIHDRYAIPILNCIAERHTAAGMSAIFLALNAKNETHSSWIKNIRQNKIWILANLGSFVIKSLPAAGRAVKINHLLLTDLWLEL